MMKKVLAILSRIYRWIIISFILQIAVLLYINNVYLNNTHQQVKATAIAATGTQKAQENEEKAEIPSEASDIKISCDGSYASYILNGNLQILDIDKKEIKSTVNIASGDTITYYRWLPDRDMIIYGIKRTIDGNTEVQISTYEVGLGNERSYPKISGLSQESEAIDIELSPLTNVVYLKIKNSDTEASIYKYNIMDNLSYITSVSTKSVTIETAYEDKLLIQDDRNKISIRSGNGNRSSLPAKGQVALLGIDSEDRVYIGELSNDNKVQKIRYGKLSSESSEWIEVGVKNPAMQGNIVITPDGSICEVSQGESSVCNLRYNTKTSFRGKYIDIINSYIVSIENNKLQLTKFK